MNAKQDIIHLLEDPIHRENLILKLKSLDKNSDIFQIYTKSIIDNLNLMKPPRGIFESTTLQNAFKFCDHLECFTNFRLVCKSWKNAIETIRFSRVEHTKIILSHFIQKFPNTNYPLIYSKYFKCLQCLHIEISNKNIVEKKIDNAWPHVQHFLLKNVSNLKSISFHQAPKSFYKAENLSFFHSLLKKSQSTLLELNLIPSEHIFLPPALKIPKLRIIFLHLSTATGFDHIPKIISNTPKYESLQSIYLKFDFYDTKRIPKEFFDYMIKNHSERIFYCNEVAFFDHFPVKIYEGWEIHYLEDCNFGDKVEYIFFDIGSPEHLNYLDEIEWLDFRNSFQKLNRVKGVLLKNECDVYTEKGIFCKDSYFTLTEKTKTFFQQFTSYLKNDLHIQIFGEDEFDFFEKSCLESWKFCFLNAK